MSGGAPEWEAREATRRARSDLAVCREGPTYMNLGGAGPLPDPAGEALIAEVRSGMRAGRGSLATVRRVEAAAASLRAQVAALIGAQADEIALTGNTTVGVNIGLWGIDWRPGDRIITTLLEHPGVSVPVATIARRHGVEVDRISAAQARRDLAGAVRERCTARTRALVLSHVAYGTGEVLDVAGACRACGAAEGIIRIIDGAQSVGAIPVDVSSLGADVYAFPAHKWLHGPEGLGALWVSRRIGERLEVTYSGYETGTGHTPAGGITPHPGARRHEPATLPFGLLTGWAAALTWLEGFGWDHIHRRIRAGRAAAVAALQTIPDVHIELPSGPQAGLLTFRIGEHDPVWAAARMVEAGVIVRWLPDPRALRASIGFHWDEGDIERLARAVRAVRDC